MHIRNIHKCVWCMFKCNLIIRMPSSCFSLFLYLTPVIKSDIKGWTKQDRRYLYRCVRVFLNCQSKSNNWYCFADFDIIKKQNMNEQFMNRNFISHQLVKMHLLYFSHLILMLTNRTATTIAQVKNTKLINTLSSIIHIF